jgi:hypothetical protein
MKGVHGGSKAGVWSRRVRQLLSVSLLTMLFLFAPAMQGTGFTAGTQSQHRDPDEQSLDRAAQAAVSGLVARP